MSLATYQRERREVALPGGDSFHVQGITPAHLSILIRTHLPDLESVLSLINRGQELTLLQAEDFVTTLIGEAPGLCANIIALSAGEPEQAAKIQSSLPFPTQIQALVDIAEMTFTEVGGVKKFLSRLSQALNLSPTMAAQATRTLTSKVESFVSTLESAET